MIDKNPRSSLLTVIDSSTIPRYVCFTDNKNALHCITYISKFRSEYGYYPIMDFSKEDKRIEIKLKLDSTRVEPSRVAKFFEIETYDEMELDDLCTKNAINIFCIHKFSYYTKKNNMELLLSAQEFDGKPDLTKFAENLNVILNR
jgi:hypothetical protein